MALRRLGTVALGVLVAAWPLTGHADPPEGADCSYKVIVFTATGAYLPGGGTAAAPQPHSGVAGCRLDELGVEADTFYVYPGSTMARGRLVPPTASEQSGCLESPEGDLLVESYCGTWRLVEGIYPGSRYAETPWIAMDPTQPSGTLRAHVDGSGASNVYRTLDRG